MKIKPKEIKQIFKDAGVVGKARPRWIILDWEFILPTDEEIWDVVGKDNTDRRSFITNYGDCDNYAFELRAAFERRGFCLGVIAVRPADKSEDHSVFFWINNNKELKFVEPQDDSIFNKKFTLLAAIMY